MSKHTPGPSQSAQEWAEKTFILNGIPLGQSLTVTIPDLASLISQYAESVKPKVPESAERLAKVVFDLYQIRPNVPNDERTKTIASFFHTYAEQQTAKLREALEESLELLRLCDPSGFESRHHKKYAE